MDVGGRATQDAKAGDFVALRDFVRERRYLGVRSTEQNSLRAAKDKRDREHVYEISGLISTVVSSEALHQTCSQSGNHNTRLKWQAHFPQQPESDSMALPVSRSPDILSSDLHQFSLLVALFDAQSMTVKCSLKSTYSVPNLHYRKLLRKNQVIPIRYRV